LGIRRRNGRYVVEVYNPQIGGKVHAGTRAKYGDAKRLFEDKTQEFRGIPAEDRGTVRAYAERWLKYKHGNNTRRPALSTFQVNRDNLKPFLEEFGSRPVDGISRSEALDWARQNAYRAKSVSAMFNDAIDDEVVVTNPFANRRQTQPRGRMDIEPFTEEEVERLGEIAERVWFGYGTVCRAWIMFGAWVGARPGEYLRLSWDDLNWDDGTVAVKRCKRPYRVDVVVFPKIAQDAVRQMRRTSDALFPTVTGRRMAQGSSGYYWRPVVAAFTAQLSAFRRAEFEKVSGALDLYALRHFCASQIVARGGNEYDVSSQLGNTPEVARETYIHSYKERQRDRLRGLLDPAPVADLSVVRESRGA
jgi:integrase